MASKQQTIDAEQPPSIYGRKLSVKDAQGRTVADWAKTNFTKEGGVAASQTATTPLTVEAPATPDMTARNQLSTMAMADDARLSRPSQPPVPNKPLSQPVTIDAPTPTFSNNASFIREKGLTVDRGDGVTSNLAGDVGKPGGGLTTVQDIDNVIVTPGGKGFVAGPAGAGQQQPRAVAQPSFSEGMMFTDAKGVKRAMTGDEAAYYTALAKQQAAGQQQTIDGPISAGINRAPTSSDLLANVSLGSDFGSIKAIQMANALATDAFNREQTNIANVNRERRLDQEDVQLDLRQQTIDAEAPNRTAQARLYAAQADAAEYANTPEGRAAAQAGDAAKLQRDYDKEDNDLFQKTYSDLLKSYEGSGEAITDEQRMAAETQANALVSRRKLQRALEKATPEERKAYDKAIADEQWQRDKAAYTQAMNALIDKGDIAGQDALRAEFDKKIAARKKLNQ